VTRLVFWNDEYIKIREIDFSEGGAKFLT